MTPGTASLNLGTACSFAVLAGTSITNSGLTTITGDVGSPSETGFGTVVLVGTNHNNDSTTVAALGDLNIAYTDGQSRSADDVLAAELGTTTVLPGVHSSISGAFHIGGTVTLDAGGNTAAVFIMKMSSTLVTAANSMVSLSRGAQASNVFWVVGSSATLGQSSTLEGSILALTAITFGNAATVHGRSLAHDAAVTLDTSTVTNSIACGLFTPTPTRTPSASTSSTPTGDHDQQYCYPSPAQGDSARIVYWMRTSGGVAVKLYNQTGRQVDIISENKSGGWQNSQVSIGKFASGTYYFQVVKHFDDGSTESQAPGKFVVLH